MVLTALRLDAKALSLAAPKLRNAPRFEPFSSFFHRLFAVEDVNFMLSAVNQQGLCLEFASGAVQANVKAQNLHTPFNLYF